MKRILNIIAASSLLLTLLTPVLTTAQTINLPAKSEGDILFYFDTGSFRAKGNRVYQEFYYQIPLTELAFARVDEGFIDTLEVFFIMSDTSGSKFIKDSWNLPVFSAKRENFEGRFLPDQFELSMDEGVYSAHLRIVDKNSGKSGFANLAFQAPSFQTDRLILSDIQFASNIARSSETNKFIKNGYSIIPNANRMFGNTLATLFFYIEIYNLAPADSLGTYSVEYEIADIQNNSIRRYPEKRRQKPGNTSAEVGAISLAIFKQPYYRLNVRVKDNDTHASAEISRIFWQQQPEQPVTQAAIAEYKNAAAERVARISASELAQHFEQMQYFLSDEDKKAYGQLTGGGRRRFFINFWNSLDPNPNTYKNEFWVEYFKRIEYSNNHFTAGFKTGWKTDRGRIAIKFGIPDDRRQYSVTVNTRPYEEWHYYREEGKRFIFIDEEGTGQYRLIYSSDDTEFTDPDWQDLVGR